MSIAEALIQKGQQDGRLKGEQLGLRKGEQLGMRKGEQVGMRKGLEEAAIGMLRRGMQAKEVIEITHLSKQRITELLASIKQNITKGG